MNQQLTQVATVAGLIGAPLAPLAATLKQRLIQWMMRRELAATERHTQAVIAEIDERCDALRYLQKRQLILRVELRGITAQLNTEQGAL